MKIFISYGHDDHTALVNAVYDALLEAGHEPWKDDRYEGHSGIAAGKDFTRVIYRAIQESDFVLAFATNKTMEKPYCCDERQYAYNAKGRRFIQLRLDGVDIQLGNAGSYIDMDAVEESTGRINQKLLQEKLQAVYAAFRAPENLLSPNAKYERYLKIKGTVPYEEFITMPETDDFVGREWLKEQCKAWALDASIPCRLFVILGEAGSGKTAFVRHLSEDKELVRSVHVCIFDRPKTRSINETLKNLAFTLTQNNYRYSDFLKNKDFEQLADLDYAGLFEFLFIEPLKNETEKYLLIIDGLDELEETTGLNPLIQLLRQYAGKINPNISILVTGRPDENIINKLKTVSRGKTDQRVLLSRENGQDDLNEFIRRKLTELGCHTDALQQRIFEACDGNFEYLTLLFREAFEEGLELTGDMVLPRGLQERYTQYLDRRMEKNDQDEALTKEQYRLLSVLAVAYEPMPRSLLAEITGYDAFDVNRELKVFGSLIRQTAAPDNDRLISFFSKGFRDYLLSGEYDNYAVSAAEGTQALADYTMKHCTTEAAFARIPYLDRYGFTHLLLSMRKNKDAAEAYLDRMKQADMDKTMRRIASALCTGEQAAVEVFFAGGKDEDENFVLAQLIDMRAVPALTAAASAYDQLGHTVNSLALQTSILNMNPSPEAKEKMHHLLKTAQAICEEAYQSTPNKQSRHGLVEIYAALGNFGHATSPAESTAETAEGNMNALALAELNYRENPCYLCRRDLLQVYASRGYDEFSTFSKEEYAAATLWFEKFLELAEENYREQPCYQSRYDLISAYGAMAFVMEDQKEEWDKKGLELSEKNYRENPCYASRETLSTGYRDLGDNGSLKGTREGQAEMEHWYMKALQLDEMNFQEDPCYSSRSALSKTYERMRRISEKMYSSEELSETEYWNRKKLALDEQNYQENPCDLSRHALRNTYSTLASICRRKRTPEGLAEAIAWCLKQIPLLEQDYLKNPGKDSRLFLTSIYGELGDICWDQSTPDSLEEAGTWYRKKLSLEEMDYQEDPSDSNRLSLMLTYGNLGDLCLEQDSSANLEEAIAWYSKELALREQECQENPSPLNKQSLSSHYRQLGNLYRKKATPEGRAEAEQWYVKHLSSLEECYREDPTEDNKYALASTYGDLADICREKATPESLEEAECWCRKKLEIVEQYHRERGDHYSRNALSSAYMQLGDIFLDKGRSENIAEAEHWYKQSLTLAELNYQETPDRQSRRTLGQACLRLGTVAEKRQTAETLTAACSLFRKALTLFEENLVDLPEEKTGPTSFVERLQKKIWSAQNHASNPQVLIRGDIEHAKTRLAHAQSALSSLSDA